MTARRCPPGLACRGRQPTPLPPLLPALPRRDRSARAAMEGKLSVLGDSSAGDGALSPAQAAQLAGHPAWQRSGFEELERFIFTFLTGGAGVGAGAGGNGAAAGRAGAESVRLKLEASRWLGAIWVLGLGRRAGVLAEGLRAVL